MVNVCCKKCFRALGSEESHKTLRPDTRPSDQNSELVPSDCDSGILKALYRDYFENDTNFAFIIRKSITAIVS